MTPVKLLGLYQEYLVSQHTVAVMMKWAIKHYEAGYEESCWECLLHWEEAKDKRTAIWRKLQDHYPRALCIKEGVMS